MDAQQANDQQRHSVEFLIAEYEHLANSFWRNEEGGEKRINFFIVFVTAVISALGVLATSEKIDSQNVHYFYLTAVFALLALLWFGIVMLQRMIKRNQVTDEYKLEMDMIRSHLRSLDKLPRDYHSFGKGLLFCMESEFECHLDILDKGGKLTPKLKEKFSGGKNCLSEEATGRILKEGRGWVLTDKKKKKMYIVWKEREQLKVFDIGKPRQPRTGGYVEMVRVMNNFIVAALSALVIILLSTLVDFLQPWQISIKPWQISICALVVGLFGFFITGWRQNKYVEKRYGE